MRSFGGPVVQALGFRIYRVHKVYIGFIGFIGFVGFIGFRDPGFGCKSLGS